MTGRVLSVFSRNFQAGLLDMSPSHAYRCICLYVQKAALKKTGFTDGELNRLIKHMDRRIARLGKLAADSPRFQFLSANRNDALFWRVATVIARSTGLRMMEIAGLERKSCFSSV